MDGKSSAPRIISFIGIVFILAMTAAAFWKLFEMRPARRAPVNDTVQKSNRHISLWSGKSGELEGTRSLEELLDLYSKAKLAQDVGAVYSSDNPVAALALSLNETELVTLTKHLLVLDKAIDWRGISALIERCGEIDPGGTIRFLRKMRNLRLAQELAGKEDSRDPKLESGYFSAFYQGWAKSDPKAAWTSLSQNQRPEEEKDDPSMEPLSSETIPFVLSRLAETDPDFVLSVFFGEGNDSNFPPLGFMEPTIIKKLPRDSDWELISTRFVKKTPLIANLNSYEVEETTRILFSRLAEEDLDQARAWFQTLPKELQYGEAIPFGDGDAPESREKPHLYYWVFDSPHAGDLWLKKMVESGKANELAEWYRLIGFAFEPVSRKHLDVWRYFPDQGERAELLLRVVDTYAKREPADYGSRNSGIFLTGDLKPADIEKILPGYELTSEQESNIRARLQGLED